MIILWWLFYMTDRCIFCSFVFVQICIDLLVIACVGQLLRSEVLHWGERDVERKVQFQASGPSNLDLMSWSIPWSMKFLEVPWSSLKSVIREACYSNVMFHQVSTPIPWQSPADVWSTRTSKNICSQGAVAAMLCGFRFVESMARAVSARACICLITSLLVPMRWRVHSS